MTFNLNEALIYKSVVFYRFFPAGVLRFWRILFFILGVSSFIVWRISQFIVFPYQTSAGWSLIFISAAFSVLFFEIFGGYYLKFPKIKATNNIADYLEYEAASIFSRSFKLSRSWKENELSTRALLAVMLDDEVMGKVLTRIMPSFRSIRKQLKDILDNAGNSALSVADSGDSQVSSEVIKILQESLEMKDKHGSQRISILDIFAVMYDHNDRLKQFIILQDLDKKDLEELAEWYENIWSFWREMKKFWSLDNLLRQPPIGRSWVYGYARHLTAFAINLTDQVEFSRPIIRLIRRKKEIDQMEQILSRSGENNILLVGEEGVGKENIILDFTELIAKGRALPQLNYKKVYDLNLSLVAGASKEITDIQNLLVNIFNEAVKAGNIILILRDFHNFIGEIEGLGRIDVSEIIVPYLKSASVQVIATTNPASFHKFIENRSELTDVFDRINIFEPSNMETRKIIEEIVPVFESKYQVLITYGAIKEIVDGADKYIRTAPFPEKAFDLLSEVVSRSVADKTRIITKKEVDEVISRKTGVPLGPVVGKEKDKLARMEEIMHQELIGQDRAVSVVSSTMRRLRAGLGKRGKPAGVFLFVGPTGVGKTLTAKILAKTYFGSADRMLRFDMSEYQSIDSLDRFLGSTKTQEPGQFVTQVRDNPFSLILLDEIEKANKDILNIFLQVFDEGRLTDVFGRKINFEQNIIIATSNAGADLIRDFVNEGLDPSLEKERVVDVLIKGGHFRPELLNRFDEIVIFHPLSQEQVGKITELLLVSLAARLKEQGYMFKPTLEIADYVAKAGFDPQFGARPMEMVIRDKVESIIAKKILDGSIKKGEEFILNVTEFKPVA